MFATGIASMIVLKILAAMMVPMVGMLVAFFAMALKVGFFLGIAFFLFRMFRKYREETVAA